MLSPYRVLDLTDEKGLLCGKLLGDLGADVIKIEKPGGDSARNLGPFYHDEADPEKSLFWWAFNTSKRGVTLDIELADGQDIFRRLVKGADFVIESFPPGYMDKLGLGYSALEKINPGVILVSITPFGQTGPYKNYKAADIVAWAMSGEMYPWGDADRPPIRISHHSQAYLQGATEAAVGAMMALHYRGITGVGQHVDLSIQDCLVWASFQITSPWDMIKTINMRGGTRPGISARVKRIWTCKDGYVIWQYVGDVRKKGRAFVRWLESEGMADDFLKGFDWDRFDLRKLTQEVVDRLEELMAKFFMVHTKAELYEGALKYNFALCPVNTAMDTMEDIQLAAREFWVEVEHPELCASITYPGAFAHATEAPPGISRRAPLIGEHNVEVYQEELGFSKEELMTLKQANVI